TLLRRAASFRRGAPSDPPALSRRRAGLRLPAPRARAFAAAGLLVDGGPSPALGFSLRNTSRRIPLGDVLGLALLFPGVLALVSAWHGVLLLRRRPAFCLPARIVPLEEALAPRWSRWQD